MVAFATAIGFYGVNRWIERVALAMPLPAHVPLDARLWDQTPIVVTTTAAWQKIPVRVTVDRVRSDPALCRRMFFDDFDRLPAPLRADALDAMWHRYGNLVRAPARWDHMTPRDSDLVPQPVRAMAFIEMVRYWSGYYQTGGVYGPANLRRRLGEPHQRNQAARRVGGDRRRPVRQEADAVLGVGQWRRL